MKRRGHAGTIGGYRIDGTLGHGGMGTVYRVTAPESGRFVALKILNPSEPLADFVDEENLRSIFISEACTLARLHHPNIAGILDFDFAAGRPFYTMEYFCGNLGTMIGERYAAEEAARRIPPEKTIEYGRQLLAGLACLHDEGIVHRDIKPFNVMLAADGTVKICDFGMAGLESERSFAPEGINIGSPYYTAPEQISDPEHPDHRSDLYAAGVLLYRMLTGELPGMKDFMLSRVNPLYDEAWDAFFARALSWKPELRFQNAAEMSEKLAILELHWERNRGKGCRPSPSGEDPATKLSLRASPVRASGVKAGKLFDVNNLWQPNSFIENRFRDTGSATVLDETTGLLWQRSPSDSQMDRRSADEYIKTLNAIRLSGTDSWRLPTVNELLSLAPDHASPAQTCLESPLGNGSDWFWSCDRRSRETSWYVSTWLGYAGWQNDNCCFAVRAVASKKEL